MRPNSGALRYFGRIKNGTTPASGEAEYWDGDVHWATPEDLGKLTGDRISQTKRRVTEKAVKESNLSVLPAGSVIISTRAPIGHMAINEMPMAFNQGCRGIIPGDRVHGPFLYYLLKYQAPELNAMANGTTFVELSRDELAAVPMEFPPLDTQRRIARYLDEKTARIDGLIEKKRTLLDRLAEKRQTLITRAITNGLNPDAPMKPSGIDWLSDIPAHWEVLRLKFIASEPLSYGANAAAEFNEPDWPRFVRITDVDEFGRLRDETFRSLPPEVAQGFLLQPNDILLARSGATVGKSFVYKISWGVACYAGYLIRARIKKKHDARYFYWFLNSIFYWEWVGSTFIQSTIQNINADRYANLQIPHPSDNCEQKEIVDFIEVSCAAIDRQWELIARSLERLNEHRSAMITAAVTGQLAELR